MVCGLVLLVSAAGRQSQAQPLRTLEVQDGNVYIDGKLVPEDQLPASLDLSGVAMQFQFMGDIDPVISLGERLFRVEGERLLEVNQFEDSAAPVNGAMEPVTGLHPIFPEAFVTSFAAPLAVPVTVEADHAESPAAARGQEILQSQALALQRLVTEIEALSRFEGTLNTQGGVRSVHLGHVPILRQPRQGMSPLEATLMSEKLRFQAERMALAARQLPLIEIRSYLDEVQQHDAELYDRLLHEQMLEEESLHLAARVRQVPEGRERAAREEALRNKLEEIFELRQENRRREIEQLQEQLGELQRRLDQRERLHERIIENRIQELARTPATLE